MAQTNIICLTDQEAGQFSKNRSMVILRLLKPQPPEGCDFKEAAEVLSNGASEVGIIGLFGRPSCIITLRYPSGVYGLRETWVEVGRKGNYDYKSNGTIYYPNGEVFTGWNSPVTMPLEAVRWTGIEVDTTVKRVQELTFEDYQDIGFILSDYLPSKLIHSSIEADSEAYSKLNQTFITQFNSLHAKPVKKGDGYVCYPYGREDIPGKAVIKTSTDLKGNKIDYGWDGKTYTWEGKQLTIHANPYLMVLRLEKK